MLSVTDYAKTLSKLNLDFSLDGHVKLLRELVLPKQKGICCRCRIRPIAPNRLSYCLECSREVIFEERDRKAGVTGRVHKRYKKVRVTKDSNVRFFDENYEFICQNVKRRAWEVAKITRDFSSVQDYYQEMMIYVWKQTLDYDEERIGHDPKSFVSYISFQAKSHLWAKLAAKKRRFWASVLFLEELKLYRFAESGKWEEWLAGKRKMEKVGFFDEMEIPDFSGER